MRELHDNQSNIDWINISYAETRNIPEYFDYIQQLDKWTDNSDIRRFIGNEPIGKFVDYSLQYTSDTDIYFAKSGDEILAVAILSHELPLVRADEILDYLYHKKNHTNYSENIIPDEEFLSNNDLEKLLQNKDENFHYCRCTSQFHENSTHHASYSCS